MNARYASTRERFMKSWRKIFKPVEVLFSPTSECNLSCRHCDNENSSSRLSPAAARKFLDGCGRMGVERVGFTGGEPFLALSFLCDVAGHAIKTGFLFDRIMTNGVWYNNKRELDDSLKRLYASGYDGSICVSVDAFHRQRLPKLAYFIKKTLSTWKRPDVVSIACVVGGRDRMTERKIKGLANILKARLLGFGGKNARVKGGGVFIKILKIDLSVAGRAGKLKSAWGNKWFTEDYCEGPGNVFFVNGKGDVRPCCGYAAETKTLKIGNIYKDSPSDMIKKARNNRFIFTVFSRGLSKIRENLESQGLRFPGKTDDNCFFCDYLMKKVPAKILSRCLVSARAVILAASILLSAIQAVSAAELVLGTAKEYNRIYARVIKRVGLPRWYHEGLFYDGEFVWVSNGEKGDTWVVDPYSGEVRRRIAPVAGFTEAITTDGNGTFVLTDWNEKKIYRIRIEGDRMVAEADRSFAPAYPAGVVWNGKSLLVVTWTRSLLGTKFDIIEMDADFKTINAINVKRIPEPAHMAWDGKNLWITSWFNKTVYKVDIDKWEIAGYFKSPVSKTTGIAWDGRYFWITGTRADLYQVGLASS